MKLNTVKFGEIEVNEDKLYDFIIPILGFDNLRKFIILEPNHESLFKWLQSVEDPALAFPIISVSHLDYDYTIDILDNVVQVLEIENVEDVLVMNIVSIPNDEPQATTINLLAPLLFNVSKGIAGQVILSGSGYEISHPMFKEG